MKNAITILIITILLSASIIDLKITIKDLKNQIHFNQTQITDLQNK